jgi:cbb3-type cytochrome oxidase subunit 3
MIMTGWINFGISALLFCAIAVVVFYYYRPRSKEIIEHDEAPKWRMLEDDDERAA